MALPVLLESHISPQNPISEFIPELRRHEWNVELRNRLTGSDMRNCQPLNLISSLTSREKQNRLFQGFGSRQ